MKYTKKLYIILFISIIVAIIYLFISTNHIQTTINKNMEQILIQQVKSFTQNINLLIKKEIKNDPYRELKQNSQLHNKLEEIISIIVNDSLKHIFVLYKDDKNTYRYLLDGSKEKSEFNERLSVNKKYWNKVYITKKDVVINQNNLQSIWITYLQPIIFDNKVKAVIAVDFSTKLPTRIYYAIDPLKKIFTYIFISIGVLILILIYQTLLSIKNKKASITDELTQVYNRNFLKELLKEIDISKYQILMLDIDYFKQVNDNYGHKAGDMVLSKTAQIIKNEIREDDFLIRFGGEEFLIFTKRNQKVKDLAFNIAQRIRKKVEKYKFIYENQNIKITISIGVTSVPEHFKSITSAIKHTDEMLYRAKKEGRNLVISSKTSLNQTQVEKKTINDVKEALEEDRITCYFQPIYSTKNQTIIKYEALVRLIEKDNKVISPYFFLDTITHTNVYNDLTKRVLEIVFKKIKDKKVTIGLNLNFSDILDNKIYNIILNKIQKNKQLAKWLVIELLEYELIEDASIIKEKLLKIKSFGVKIAIDDFRSGYSNYSIFKTLPIDILKIDGSLIKDINTSKTSYTLANSIIMFSKELNITTVAEFVHSKEVFKVVKQLQVDEIQGFYLSKPLKEIKA
jgi:diguanylate cyclase (GGDEF)-like protein